MKSDEYKHGLLDNALIGVFRTNLKGDIIYTNDAFARMFEFSSANELIKEGIAPRWANPEKRRPYLEQLKNKGRLDGYEFEGLTRTGKKITLLSSIVLEGEELSCVAIDITERKRIEEALEKSEERYKLAEHAAKMGSWDWDILTGSLSWSETIEPIFGFEKGKFGATYEAFLKSVHPDDRQRVIDAINACVEKGNDYQIEHRIVWPDGSVRWVLETGNVVRESGKAIRMLGVVQDITERKMKDEKIESLSRFPSENPSPVMRIAYDCMILYANAASKTMLDYWKRSVGERVPPGLAETIKDAAVSGKRKDAELEIEGRFFACILMPVAEQNYINFYGRDITERKKAEVSLKHEKEFSENILRTMPDGLDIVDKNLRIVHMNKALADIFGKDNTGKKCYEVYRTDGKQCENCPLKSQLNGRTEALEVSGIKGGKTFLVSHTSIMLNGEKHILEIFNDITERKQMEEKMLNLSRAVEQSHASIIITDTEGTIEYVNPHFVEITGYSAKEAVGKNPRILKSGKQPREVYKEMWDTIKSGRDWQGEFCNKKKSGELYWERVSVSPIKDARGNVIRFVAVKEDITGRKKTEDKLNELTEYLQEEKDILETVMKNTETHLAYLNNDFNFVMVNPTYAEGSGHTTEELIGKNHFDLFPNKENEAVFRRVRDSGKAVEFHAKPFVYADQPERGVTYWDWTLAPIKDHAGKVKGLVLSLVDITHRKVIEDSLKNAYERLKKVDQLKSSILRDVSHELRHPISLINMATNFLDDEVKKDAPNKNKMEQYIDIMRRNSKTFDQKLASVVELSKLQALETLAKEELNIAEIAREAMQTNHDFAKEKGIAVKSDLDEGIVISGNKEMISSLIGNLISNAIKYTNKGFIKVTCSRERKNVVISVKDTGVGINRENLEKIFEPFFKEDLSSEGIGVGLAICKKVVELHNGEIKVVSAPGKGSAFTVMLPIM